MVQSRFNSNPNGHRQQRNNTLVGPNLQSNHVHCSKRLIVQFCNPRTHLRNYRDQTNCPTQAECCCLLGSRFDASNKLARVAVAKPGALLTPLKLPPSPPMEADERVFHAFGEPFFVHVHATVNRNSSKSSIWKGSLHSHLAHGKSRHRLEVEVLHLCLRDEVQKCCPPPATLLVGNKEKSATYHQHSFAVAKPLESLQPNDDYIRNIEGHKPPTALRIRFGYLLAD